MPATSSTNGISAKYVVSAPFSRLCLEKLHRQAQCLFISSHLRQLFAAQRKTTSRTCHQDRTKGLDNRRKAPQIEDRLKCPQNRRACRARNLSMGHRRTSSGKIEAEEVRSVNAATNKCPQRASLESERQTLPQALNSGDTSMYPSRMT